jgi:hypothetical protein
LEILVEKGRVKDAKEEDKTDVVPEISFGSLVGNQRQLDLTDPDRLNFKWSLKLPKVENFKNVEYSVYFDDMGTQRFKYDRENH